jgi:uncharacterized repeat protein (TIGR01451 family)
MAGKLRFAAKLFLATTVLAGGGAGAYYGTTRGWPTLLRPAPSDQVTLQPETGELQGAAFAAGSNLDAVASAWAEPPSTPADKPDSSATARTAKIGPQPEQADTPPIDRYTAASELPAPPAAQHAALEQHEPSMQLEADAAPAGTVAEEPRAAPADDLAASEAPSTPEVARGQEPKEDSLTAQEAFAEPEPLETSGVEQGIASADPQSREASGAVQSATNNDRYGAAAEAPREPAIVNPFGSKAPSGGPTAEEPQAIEPLPALPDEIGGQVRELEPDDRSQAERSARATSNAARDSFTRPKTNASVDAFDPTRAEPMPIASGLPSDGAGQPTGKDGSGRPGERALEGAQRPALEIQKFAPPEIQVGKPAKFVLQLRNVGTQAAEAVTVRDEVPQGTRLIATTPTAKNESGHLTWELGKLSPGEDRTVELQLMPTAEGEIGSVATVSYSAQASVKTRCTMPQLAIRMTAPGKVMVGHEQRVKIELHNPGSGDATGVMLFENVPQNVRHAAGPALEFEVGTLRAGETRELELVLFAEKAGRTVNVLSARADGNLQVQQQVEFDVIAPELTVDVDGPERRYLERPATYEVSVENPGTAPAHDVQIITKLPKGMRFVRANNMGEYDANSHAVYWSLAELPEGERGTVELVAMPVETGSQMLEVESRAGEGLSDQARREIVVDGLAAIMFELHDLEDPIEVGGETGYEIRVVNQGTKAAANVQVAVQLPAGLQLISAEAETQHTAQQGRIVFDPISELAPKADTLYRVRVKGVQPGDQRVLVEVNTDEVTQPIRREESTHVFGDE